MSTTSTPQPEPWIETSSGVRLLFTRKPWELADQIRIEDIAAGLSKMCRYAGQVREDVFYSVAEHSALVANALYQATGNRRLSLAALLHDGTEAFLPDIPSPLKALLPDYYELELHLMRAISHKWGLGDYFWTTVKTPVPFKTREYCRVEMDPRIAEYDARIIVNERLTVMGDSGHAWLTDGLEPLRVYVRCLQPAGARKFFLDTYDLLKD